MALPRKAVTSNATGSVRRFGRTDFTGQFDPADFTQVTVNESATWAAGVETYHHKVIAGDLVEMSAAEKTAADAEREAEKTSRLRGAARVTLTVPDLASLPVPPPAAGYLVGVANVAGVPALAISTATGYIVFQSSGVYP